MKSPQVLIYWIILVKLPHHSSVDTNMNTSVQDVKCLWWSQWLWWKSGDHHNDHIIKYCDILVLTGLCNEMRSTERRGGGQQFCSQSDVQCYYQCNETEAENRRSDVGDWRRLRRQVCLCLAGNHQKRGTKMGKKIGSRYYWSTSF